MISFKLRPLYPEGRRSRYAIGWEAGLGPESVWMLSRRICCPVGNRTKIAWSSVLWLSLGRILAYIKYTLNFEALSTVLDKKR